MVSREIEPATPHAKAGGLWREGVETAQALGGVLAVTLALRILVFQPYTIPSSSMEPGLVTGDYIVVSKWTYGWSRASIPFDLPLVPATHGARLFGRAPQRGEVIVFRRPADPSDTIIKRLIGLPGDQVQVVKGAVLVNGRPIPRQSAGAARDHDDPARLVTRVIETAPNGRRYVTYGGAPDGEADDTDVYQVPAGTYFFMGDNRDNSLDSRWPAEIGMGFVPAQNLIGRAEAVGWSWKAGAALFKPWTWLDLDLGRLFRPIV